MSRLRRALFRTTEVLDYRTFVVATVFLILLLIGFVTVTNIQQAHDATLNAIAARKAATRRIDLLNTQIAQLQAGIAAGQDQRGQLATAVAALQAQVRQLGGQPVIVVTYRPSPAPAPASSRPTATPAPHPQPTPTRTHTPRPTPSPTCTRLPIVGTCRPKR